ncbi:hypothetical protein QOZ80_2AG0116690 [Eleusine coracana subsp. coracana]|nr:hypothetical protein QOZ80_2AG0116690 [Eleusine coracana subsp. coracana]
MMNKGEEPQQTHDRLMDIVNERRSYGDDIKDEEVNYKLLMALRMSNPTLCTIIEEKDGFESFTIDEVIGRINAHKSRDDEGKRANVLIGDESTSKKDLALKAKKTQEDNDNDDDEENDDEEEDNKELNGKGNKNEKYNKKNKYNKKPNKGQAHIGQEYISDDDEQDDEGGIANLAIGLSSAKKSLFDNLNDDENDAPRCFMAKESKEYSSDGTIWVLDSGCSNHMTGERSMFSTIDHDNLPSGGISFGNDNKGKVIVVSLTMMA